VSLIIPIFLEIVSGFICRSSIWLKVGPLAIPEGNLMFKHVTYLEAMYVWSCRDASSDTCQLFTRLLILFVPVSSQWPFCCKPQGRFIALINANQSGIFICHGSGDKWICWVQIIAPYTTILFLNVFESRCSFSYMNARTKSIIQSLPLLLAIY
jgi:hypothetical protein